MVVKLVDHQEWELEKLEVYLMEVEGRRKFEAFEAQTLRQWQMVVSKRSGLPMLLGQLKDAVCL